MTRVGASVLAALIAFGGCGSPEEAPGPVDTSTASPTATVQSTLIDVEVRDGEVVGGRTRHRVPLGNQVRLTVRSDVADEVHVHGYDERADIEAEGGVLLTFVADVAGVFEIELEERSLTLAELEVR